MPYRRNVEIPDSVKSVLPSGAQTLWRTTFNAIYEQQKSKGRSDDEAETFAFQIAWTNVKKKYEKGDDGQWRAKELGVDDIRAGIEQILNGRAGSPDSPAIANSSFWAVTDIMLNGTAWAILIGEDMREPGDMRRYAIEVRWAVENDVVRVIEAQLGVLRRVFVPLSVESEEIGEDLLDHESVEEEKSLDASPAIQAAPVLLPTTSRHTEEFEDAFRIKTPERMKDVMDGRATSAVINTWDRETGRPRYIVVSSGTFPDRMTEIVGSKAQEYSIAWAYERNMFGPLRLAHIPRPVPAGADLRTQWTALIGDYIAVFDEGLLPFGDLKSTKALREMSLITPVRVKNLIAIVGKDLARLVVEGKITADVGTCDYQYLQAGSNPEYPGRFLIESGLWDDSALAHKARVYFDAQPGEVSIGFLYDRVSLVVGKDNTVFPAYNQRIWRFERSLLPMGTAAFPASYLEGATGLATI